MFLEYNTFGNVFSLKTTLAKSIGKRKKKCIYLRYLNIEGTIGRKNNDFSNKAVGISDM